MAWSLLNSMIADKVNELLDAQKDAYPEGVERFYSREQAAAIIHAAIWGHSVRSDSTAGAYAGSNMFDALGLKWWTFDEADAARHRDLAQQIMREKIAQTSGQ